MELLTRGGERYANVDSSLPFFSELKATDNSDDDVEVICRIDGQDVAQKPKRVAIKSGSTQATADMTCTGYEENLLNCTHTVKITVKDKEAPSMTDPNLKASYCTDTGKATKLIEEGLLIPTCDDNVDDSVEATGVPSGGEFSIGVTTYTATCTDGSGNKVEKTYTFEVKDCEACKLEGSETMELLTRGGERYANVDSSLPYFSELKATDNSDDDVEVICRIDGQDVAKKPVQVAIKSGSTEATADMTCTGYEENLLNCTHTVKITVKDKEAPSMTDPNLEASYCTDIGKATRLIEEGLLIPTCDDNVDDSVEATGVPSGGEFSIGVTKYTATCTDGSGNKVEKTYTFEVKDCEACKLEGSETMELLTRGGERYVNVDSSLPFFSELKATDNSDDDVEVICRIDGQDVAQKPVQVAIKSGSTQATADMTCTGYEENLLNCTHTVKITVKDKEAPSMTDPNLKASYCTDTGKATKLIEEGLLIPTCDDNVDDSVEATGVPSGGEFSIGVTTYTATCTDGSGNKVEKTYTFEVKDCEACKLEGSETMELLTRGGERYVNVDSSLPFFSELEATDNSDDDVEVVCRIDGQDVAQKPKRVAIKSGSTQATADMTCTGYEENLLNCTHTVKITVKDKEAPSMTDPNLEASYCTDTGKATKLIEEGLLIPTCDDNVDDSVEATGVPSGGEFSIGVTKYTATCTDGSGNKVEKTYTFEVKDCEACKLEGSETMELLTRGGERYVNVDSSLPFFSELKATDNSDDDVEVICRIDGQDVAKKPVQVAIKSGSTQATADMTCTGYEENLLNCTHTVKITVKDKEAPSMTDPNLKASYCTDTGKATKLIEEGLLIPTCDDNVDDSVEATGVPSGGEFSIGVTTYTATCTDGSGNKVEKTYTFEVKDCEACKLEGSETMELLTRGGERYVNVDSSLPFFSELKATDNSDDDVEVICRIDGQDVAKKPVQVAIKSGSTQATADMTCTGYEENLLNCTHTVKITVKDKEAPSMTDPNLKASYCTDTGKATRLIEEGLLIPTCEDNVDNSVEATGVPSGGEFSIGVTKYTATCTDGSGNKVEKTYTFEVKDCEACKLEGSETMELLTKGGERYANVDSSLPFFSELKATDNSDDDVEVICRINGQDVAQKPVQVAIKSGSTQGTSDMTCTGYEENLLNCTHTVKITVKDNEAPSMTDPNLEASYCTDTGKATKLIEEGLLIPTCEDNVDDSVEATGVPSGGEFPIGVTTYTATCTDGSGNKVEKTYTFEVKDCEKCQFADTPDSLAFSTDPTKRFRTITMDQEDMPRATDNSGQVDVECTMGKSSMTNGGEMKIYIPKGKCTVSRDITCVGTDKAGLNCTKSITITVSDNEPPRATEVNNVDAQTIPGRPYALLDLKPPVCLDNMLEPYNATCKYPLQGPFGIGFCLIPCNCTDLCGHNVDTHFNVTVTFQDRPKCNLPELFDNTAQIVWYKERFGDKLYAGSWLVIDCKPGFEMAADSQSLITCQATANGVAWDRSPPTCVPSDDPPQVSCPKNFELVQYNSSFPSYCYHFVKVGDTRDKVAEECKQRGGHLADIDSYREHISVIWWMGSAHNAPQQMAWISAKRSGAPANGAVSLVNSKGDSQQLTLWCPDAPSVGNTDEECTITSWMGWNDVKCSNKHVGLCEADPVA
ncbi:uncharacterized protein [Diadema setosum]|uniref:uncharacterized protein n=1 Tax=Diadema setosum TaxID=31175 RepID=UPI003B3A72D8